MGARVDDVEMTAFKIARRVAGLVVTLLVVVALATAVFYAGSPPTATASSTSSSRAAIRLQASGAGILRIDTSVENLIDALVDSGTEDLGTTDSGRQRRKPAVRDRAVA